MERCKFSKRLSYYLADELSNAEKAIIDNHLPDCHICRRELATLQADELLIKDFLADYQTEEISADLQKKILSIPQQSAKPKFYDFAIKFSIAASVIISFSLGVLISSALLNEEEIVFSEESLVDIEQLYSYGGE
ncbi:MAG: hypothetical protein R6U84_08825 [Candidatus Cloacimonadales bacterium]